MLTFLRDNHEWLFSGVGAIVLASVASLAVGVLSKYTRSRVSQSAESQKKMEDLSSRRTPLVRGERLSAKCIVQSILQYPLLKQRDAADEYVGLPVSWVGAVVAAVQRPSGLVLLEVSVDAGVPNVYIEVNPDGYSGLSLLKAGDVLAFSAKLQEIRPRDGIFATDAILRV